MRMRAGLLAMGLFVSACGGARLQVAAATPGVALDPLVEKDIRAGYLAYAETLTRWGRWEDDEWYAVRWCPTNPGRNFQPYRSRGHWGESPAPVGASPAGSPYWMSDDRDTWGDITSHHGWWVHLDSTRSWCWVPGLEETPGRVVWRTGEGFVGWAPESPSWVDDEGGGDLLWAFAFLGSLLEPDLEPQLLEGDAGDAAAAATMPVNAQRDGASARLPRVGPPATLVVQARAALVEYARVHEGALPTPKLAAPAASKPSSGSVAASETKKDELHLPGGMSVAARMMQEPMSGPSGLTPRFYRPADPSPYGGSTTSAHSSSYASSPSSSSSGGSSSSSSVSVSHVSSSSTSSSSSSSSHSIGHRR